MNLADYDVLECDVRPTSLGEALRIRIHRKDMAPMGWRELADLFNKLYPGRWACQMFPPQKETIDQANKYHLFVFDQAPQGLDLLSASPVGTRTPRSWLDQ
jgi:hypothetical protein